MWYVWEIDNGSKIRIKIRKTYMDGIKAIEGKNGPEVIELRKIKGNTEEGKRLRQS